MKEKIQKCMWLKAVEHRPWNGFGFHFSTGCLYSFKRQGWKVLPQKGGADMKEQISVKARSCCTSEKRQLVKAIRACDYCSTSYKRHLACYRRAARNGGRNAKNCMIM
jgi:hypothetical protein